MSHTGELKPNEMLETDSDGQFDAVPEPTSRLSAKATGRAGLCLSAAEVEAAEEEALAWARRSNCC